MVRGYLGCGRHARGRSGERTRIRIIEPSRSGSETKAGIDLDED